MKDITTEIIHLFKKYGHIEYGENCSQLAHSVQAGLIAKADGFDDEMIVAAFLHDIGHLYPLELKDTNIEKMGDFGIEKHDAWGAQFLKEKGFSEKIVATVKNHVNAKRYLCFADLTYYDQLSEASRETMKYQGGVMSEAEALQFEAQPFFMASIEIRKIDEAAKGIDFEMKEEYWTYFSDLIDKVLS